jgi:hypothetical protein
MCKLTRQTNCKDEQMGKRGEENKYRAYLKEREKQTNKQNRRQKHRGQFICHLAPSHTGAWGTASTAALPSACPSPSPSPQTPTPYACTHWVFHPNRPRIVILQRNKPLLKNVSFGRELVTRVTELARFCSILCILIF